jgi:hypothetical protein
VAAMVPMIRAMDGSIFDIATFCQASVCMVRSNTRRRL